MSNTKHTPGPWKIQGSVKDFPALFINSDGNICKINHEDYGISISNANAKLIAASPDMFEVISDLLDSYQNGNYRLEYSSIERMKAIINKITDEKINH